MVLGGKLGANMQPRDAKALGGKMQPRDAKALGGKMQPRDAKALGGKRAGAAKWAKAAAAAGGLRKDLGPEKLAELALKMAMERLEAKAKANTKRAVATL
jgi:hypothetical protein